MQGSVEAVRQSLEKLSNDEVRVRTIHGGVGAITETGRYARFRVQRHHHRLQRCAPTTNAREIAEREENSMSSLYRVIYQRHRGRAGRHEGSCSRRSSRESMLGHADRAPALPRSPASAPSPAAYVTDGKIARNAQHSACCATTWSCTRARSIPSSASRTTPRKSPPGYECGIGIAGYNDIKENDVIECFEMEEIQQ